MIDENNGESNYFICVPCKEKKGFYRVQTIWNENELNITLLDGSLAFKSSSSRNDLSTQADALNMKYDDYIRKVISGLKNDESEVFLYERKDDNFYIFRQHKTMKIILIKCYLEQIDFMEAAEIFIDKINYVSNFYKKQFEKCNEDQKFANEEKNKATEKLEKYVILKEQTENDLYSKFILILNEKKKRIQHLLDLVEAYKKGVVQDPDSEFEEVKKTKKSKGKTIKSKKPAIVKQKPKEIISESDSASETDTENEDYTKKITHKVQIEPQPNNKRKFNFFNKETTSKISLPKRSSKISKIDEDISLLSSNKIEKSDKSNEKQDDHSQDMLDEIFTSNEMIMKQNSFLEEDDRKHLSETPDFSTQDLLDRL